MRPFLIDTTLRDGEQAPGVAFSVGEKFETARLLDLLGVDEVEAGTPAIGAEEQEAIRRIASGGFRFRTSSWCRALEKDIAVAATLGTTSVNISLPVSDIQMATLGKSKVWVMHQLNSCIRQAKGLFAFVTMGAQDATRADSGFLDEYIAAAFAAGADRVRIADTVGMVTPMEVALLFNTLKGRFPSGEFEFHAHNDLGMATANSITALQSGAACVSATINGIGERAGNAALEEIVAWLQHTGNASGRYTNIVGTLCRYISDISHITPADKKPVTGSNAFRHESGIHTFSLRKNPATYQALDPHDFGCSPMSFCTGKHSAKKIRSGISSGS